MYIERGSKNCTYSIGISIYTENRNGWQDEEGGGRQCARAHDYYNSRSLSSALSDTYSMRDQRCCHFACVLFTFSLLYIYK